MCGEKKEQEKDIGNDKKELVASILEVSNEEEDYLQMNEEVRNAKELKDGIALIKKYEDLLKGANRKIINIVGKHGEIVKRLIEEDEFFDCVGLARSNIYFKISLYKFLRKFSLLKNSTLTSSYFKSNFEVIKNVCKANVNIFGEESKNTCFTNFYIFYPCLD